MYKNRLFELTEFSKRPSSIGSKIKSPLLSATTRQNSQINSCNDIIYQEIKLLIDEINTQTENLNKLKQQYTKIANPKKQKELIKLINKISQNANPKMKQLQSKINSLVQPNKNNNNNNDTSNNKIRNLAMTRKTNLCIGAFKDIQQKFSTLMKQNIKRQANVIRGEEVTDQEVDDIVQNPQKSQQMILQHMLDTPSVQLQNTVSDIMDKCRDVIRLEQVCYYLLDVQNMHECLGMMEQLSLLVKYQEEQIHSIADAVMQTKNYVYTAQSSLVNAKTEHKKAKSKMCCIIMLLMTLVGIVVIPILITQLS